MIEKINNSNHEQFMAMLDGIFEHSPWIVERTDALKPFSSLSHLHQVMVNIVENSLFEQQLALIQAHPHLGDRVSMTTDSIKEQKRAGLQDLTPDEYKQFISMNRRYIEKFGFPFIMAVRGKNIHHIYEAMKSRIHHPKDLEFQNALKEIYRIAWFRLEDRMSQYSNL